VSSRGDVENIGHRAVLRDEQRGVYGENKPLYGWVSNLKQPDKLAIGKVS